MNMCDNDTVIMLSIILLVKTSHYCMISWGGVCTPGDDKGLLLAAQASLLMVLGSCVLVSGVKLGSTLCKANPIMLILYVQTILCHFSKQKQTKKTTILLI